MNKEQQIEEIMLTIPQKIVAYNGDPKGQHLYGEQRLQIAEVLYNAGYRKVPKGSFVCSGSETNLDVEVCNNCGMQQADELFERDKEIERLQKENEALKRVDNRVALYAVICDNVKRIFYEDGGYKEVRHYSVIHTVPNSVAIYYGKFDMKEAADERCEKLNKEWEECFGEQK